MAVRYTREQIENSQAGLGVKLPPPAWAWTPSLGSAARPTQRRCHTPRRFAETIVFSGCTLLGQGVTAMGVQH